MCAPISNVLRPWKPPEIQKRKFNLSTLKILSRNLFMTLVWRRESARLYKTIRCLSMKKCNKSSTRPLWRRGMLWRAFIGKGLLKIILMMTVKKKVIHGKAEWANPCFIRTQSSKSLKLSEHRLYTCWSIIWYPSFRHVPNVSYKLAWWQLLQNRSTLLFLLSSL